MLLTDGENPDNVGYAPEERIKCAWRIVRPYDPVQQVEREAVDTMFRIA
jgi:hypothetical protein